MMIKRLLLTSLFLLAMYTAAQAADLVCWRTNFDDTLRVAVETHKAEDHPMWAVPVGEWFGPSDTIPYRLTGVGSAKVSFPVGFPVVIGKFLALRYSTLRYKEL